MERFFFDRVGDNDQTALCPKCGIDSVISDADLKFDNQFLEEMQKHWF